jgi:hypothetical protein
MQQQDEDSMLAELFVVLAGVEYVVILARRRH